MVEGPCEGAIVLAAPHPRRAVRGGVRVLVDHPIAGNTCIGHVVTYVGHAVTCVGHAFTCIGHTVTCIGHTATVIRWMFPVRGLTGDCGGIGALVPRRSLYQINCEEEVKIFV